MGNGDDELQNIIIPTINDSREDFFTLFKIFQQIRGINNNVRLDFSKCNYLRPNAVAFLGGLTRWMEFHGKITSFAWPTSKNKLMQQLKQNGFLRLFNPDINEIGEHAIPYREDIKPDSTSIMNYLTYSWIGKGWIKVSIKLRDAIAGYIWEIYTNSFEHSKTPIGVFSCGQHYEKDNSIVLAVIDFGKGIPVTVKEFLNSNTTINDNYYLEKAFAPGFTTRTGMPGGLGLDILKQFIQLNKGKLEIYSNYAYSIIDENGQNFLTNKYGFSGTIIYITLRCDESRYQFIDEIKY